MKHTRKNPAGTEETFELNRITPKEFERVVKSGAAVWEESDKTYRLHGDRIATLIEQEEEMKPVPNMLEANFSQIPDLQIVTDKTLNVEDDTVTFSCGTMKSEPISEDMQRWLKDERLRFHREAVAGIDGRKQPYLRYVNFPVECAEDIAPRKETRIFYAVNKIEITEQPSAEHKKIQESLDKMVEEGMFKVYAHEPSLDSREEIRKKVQQAAQATLEDRLAAQVIREKLTNLYVSPETMADMKSWETEDPEPFKKAIDRLPK